MSTTAAKLRMVLAATPAPVGVDPTALLAQFAVIAQARQDVFATLGDALPLDDDDDRAMWDEVTSRQNVWCQVLDAVRRELGTRLTAIRKLAAYDVRHDDARFEDFG